MSNSPPSIDFSSSCVILGLAVASKIDLALGVVLVKPADWTNLPLNYHDTGHHRLLEQYENWVLPKPNEEIPARRG